MHDFKSIHNILIKLLFKKYFKLIHFLLIVFIFFNLTSNTAFAIDLGYLNCDPNANCVVQIIRNPFGGNIIIENPLCIAARAACRLKCGPLNDNANRYIRDFETKISLLVKSRNSEVSTSQQLKFQLDQAQIQYELTTQAIQQFSLIVQNQNLFNQTIDELKSIANYFSNQQNSDLESFKAELGQFKLSERTINTVIFYLEQNKRNQFNVQEELNKLELIMLNPLLFAQLTSQLERIEQYHFESIENTKIVIQQIEQQILNIDQEISQLKNKIKEQEERKCPSNLL